MGKILLSFFVACVSAINWSCFLEPTEHSLPPERPISPSPVKAEILGFVQYFVDTTHLGGGPKDPSGYVIADPVWLSEEPSYTYTRVYLDDSALAQYVFKVVRIKGTLDTLKAGGNGTPLRLYPLVRVESILKVELTGFFPTAVGSHWTYSVYDSIRHRTFRATIRVVDSVFTVDRKVVYRWEVRYDSVQFYRIYISVYNDSIQEYRYNLYLVAQNLWGTIPMYLGQTWKYYYNHTPIDTTRVEATDTVSTGGGNSLRAYRIRYESVASGLHSRSYEWRWIAPSGGMVKYIAKGVDLGGTYQNEVWTLVEYRIGQ